VGDPGGTAVGTESSTAGGTAGTGAGGRCSGVTGSWPSVECRASARPRRKISLSQPSRPARRRSIAGGGSSGCPRPAESSSSQPASCASTRLLISRSTKRQQAAAASSSMATRWHPALKSRNLWTVSKSIRARPDPLTRLATTSSTRTKSGSCVSLLSSVKASVSAACARVSALSSVPPAYAEYSPSWRAAMAAPKDLRPDLYHFCSIPIQGAYVRVRQASNGQGTGAAGWRRRQISARAPHAPRLRSENSRFSDRTRAWCLAAARGLACGRSAARPAGFARAGRSAGRSRRR
jgi:hypothetical protein